MHWILCLRRSVGGLGCAVLFGGCALAAVKPLTDWDRAVAARAGFAPALASRAAWNHVLDGFRTVYHDNPADLHAPDAVNAVAELLAEEGRQTGDERLLRASIKQYEFLRTQYPGSHLRVPALLAEGRLDEELGDQANARKAYGGVVQGSPASEPAEVARGRIAALAKSNADDVAMRTPRPASAPERAAEAAARARSERMFAESPANETETRVSGTSLAEVTGIRHWSTPSYTRVAIDLGDEVKFEAARVPHPDRIYFDLHGARLAPELVGKSFDVTDDGFLRKIRAAQASGDVTRVVLDVSDVTEYSAFLLPNPYRLIIDIHGSRKGTAAPVTDSAEVPVPAGAGRAASAAANVSGLPAMATTDGGELVRPPVAAHGEPGLAATTHTSAGMTVPVPRTAVAARATQARPVPNTVAVKAPATATEVAAVSASPGRVEATSAPTSRPIAVVARPGTRAAVESHPNDEEAVVRTGHPGLVPPSKAAPGKAADRTADGETSLVRALGLRIGRIVIDAGHGGHDSGTLGVDGIEEKDVVLDVALRLGKMLHERLGAEIIYTRSDDTFIPLETRTAIANKAQADLFLSIHANSSQDETARGVETYYLNFTSDPTALDVAARENAVGGQGVHQLSDLVKKIALKDKIAESREFASDVEGSLYAGLEKGNAGLKNRGVKKAPFVVLIGANMPSILAEISFVTNARDAGQLREPDYRQRVAESLFNGVAKYENGLAGAKPAPVTRAAVK